MPRSLDRLLGQSAQIPIQSEHAKGNFAIATEGNVTQVYVQAAADVFPGALTEPDLPLGKLSEAIVDGKPDISRLLRWDYRLVETLHGRDRDLDTILAWAESDDPNVLLRFVEGEGGSGKTRLGAEAAAQLRQRGWSAGFLRRSGPIIHTPGKQGLFLIVDYPEEQRERLGKLIEAIRDHRRPGYRLRILLLSRRSFEHWSETFAPIHELCGRQSIAHLGFLSITETRALISEAVGRLGNLVGRPLPELAGLDEWIGQRAEHRLSLYALAAAVHLVLSLTPTFGLSAPEILKELIVRELTRLNGASIEAKLGPQALQRLLALATLTGALNTDGLRRLAAPEFEIVDSAVCPPTQVIDRLRELPWWDHDAQVLPALTPDLIAAALTSEVFDGRSDLAPQWLWPAIQDRIDAEFAARVGRVIYDMDRVRLKGPTELPLWLEQMVEHNPERAVAFLPLCFDRSLPHRLAGLAAKVGIILADSEGFAADESMLAAMLNAACVHLANAGRSAEGLRAIRRAVEIFERLVAADAVRFEPSLAGSLNNLANRLSEAGESAAALAAAQRGVEIRVRLAATDATRFEPDLAESLSGLANRLGDAGESAAALIAAQRAVEIRERLATDNAARFEPDLARSLNNLANRLSEAGEDAPALTAGRRAVEIYGRLAAANAARFEPELAASLHNLANKLANANDHMSALSALSAERRAVEMYGRLVTTNAARFEFALAASLSNLAIILLRVGERDAALTAARRAIEIYERLAAANAARFEPDLASSLTVLALCAQNANAALAGDAIERALPLWRNTFAAIPQRYFRQYFGALEIAADVFQAAGREADSQAARAELEEWRRRAAGEERAE